MTPTSLLGVLLFLAVILPGLSWLWVSERRGPITPRPATVAFAELTGVGTAAALVALIPVLLLGSHTAFFLDVSVLVGHERVGPYLAANLWPAYLSVFAQLALGTALAGWTATLRRPRRTIFNPGSTVLHRILETDRVAEPVVDERQRAQAFMTLQTSDGTVIEGYLRCFPTNREEPYLAVESPLFLTRADSDGDRRSLQANAVVVNMHHIPYAAVRYEDPTPGATDSASEEPSS